LPLKHPGRKYGFLGGKTSGIRGKAAAAKLKSYETREKKGEDVISWEEIP
jgi:hypothetical protein